MRNINGDLDSSICSVFLMPPRDIAEVSSSMVKGLLGPKGWQKVVRKYVSGARVPPVCKDLKCELAWSRSMDGALPVRWREQT